MATVELPDFDDIVKIAEDIGATTAKRESLSLDISIREAEIFKQCSTDTLFFVNGKPPAVSYVENTYKITGFNGELVQLRRDLAETSARLEVLKRYYELMKLRIEVWRSQQATERALT